MSDQEPPVSRWLVRKSDGTELRFPSLEALKGYILSGVVTSGDVVAPEDASWARVEDLAELASLMGMIAPPSKGDHEVQRPAPSTTSNIDNVLDNIASKLPDPDLNMNAEETSALASSPTTRPPPIPKDEQERAPATEEEDEPRTIYSGPPSFDHDPPSLRRAPASDLDDGPSALLQSPLTPDAPQRDDEDLNPLSRPLHTTTTKEDELLSGPLTHDRDNDLLSRPISRVDSSPQTHEVMTLNLRRAQRRRIISGSIVIGMLVAVAIFFAVRSIQEASLPPDQRQTEAADNTTSDEAKDKISTTVNEEGNTSPSTEAKDKAASPKEGGPATKSADDTKEGAAPDAALKSGETPPERQGKADEARAEANTAKEASASKPPAAPPKPDDTKSGTSKPSTGDKPKSQRTRSAEEESTKATTPAGIDGLLSRAKKVRKKNPTEALRLYKIVLSKNPSHGDAMQLAARAYLQLGRSTDAINLLKSCRQKRPRFSPCIYYLGRSFERAGQGVEAKKAYKTLIDEFPDSSLSTKARKKLGG